MVEALSALCDDFAMVESSEVASSNSRRLSPTGTITSLTFSCVDSFFGRDWKAKGFVNRFGGGEGFYGNAEMIDGEHDMRSHINVLFGGSGARGCVWCPWWFGLKKAWNHERALREIIDRRSQDEPNRARRKALTAEGTVEHGGNLEPRREIFSDCFLMMPCFLMLPGGQRWLRSLRPASRDRGDGRRFQRRRLPVAGWSVGRGRDPTWHRGSFRSSVAASCEIVRFCARLAVLQRCVS